jgi:hypothetical protein
MPLTKHNYMIEALPSDRSDQPLCTSMAIVVRSVDLVRPCAFISHSIKSNTWCPPRTAVFRNTTHYKHNFPFPKGDSLMALMAERRDKRSLLDWIESLQCSRLAKNAIEAQQTIRCGAATRTSVSIYLQGASRPGEHSGCWRTAAWMRFMRSMIAASGASTVPILRLASRTRVS